MLEMGYKQELHRGLGDFMNFAFGFTEVACLGTEPYGTVGSAGYL
jgi:hypothetical protein